MKSFSYYEFTSILLPGAITLFGIMSLFPTVNRLLSNSEFSIGEFGLFVLLSYAIGHLIQGLGNIIASIWWTINKGVPTDWVRQNKGEIINDAQATQLTTRVASKLDLNIKFENLSGKEWDNIVRQVYSNIDKENRERIDIYPLS